MDHKIEENDILLFDEIDGATTIDPDSSLGQFHQAVSENDFLKVSKLMRDSDVDPSDSYNDAIEWASYLGNTETVLVLLEDPRVYENMFHRDHNPLRCASEQGHTETVKLLLTYFCKRDCWNASLIASLNGHIETANLIKEYIKSGNCIQKKITNMLRRSVKMQKYENK